MKWNCAAVMEKLESGNCTKNLERVVQLRCLKIINEFCEGFITQESVSQLSMYIKNELNKEKLSKTEMSKQCRIVLGTAVGILKDSTEKKVKRNYYAAGCSLSIINDIFDKLDVDDADDLYSILWSINNRCLILANDSVNSPFELEKIIKFMVRFVYFMLSKAVTREGLFSTEHQGEVALMVTFFMAKFCSQRVDMPIRLSIGKVLLELVKPWDESVKTVTAFLPGICCQMANLACTDLNTAIVVNSLQIVETTVTTCLNDCVYPLRRELQICPTGKNYSEMFEEMPKNSENKADIDEKCCENLKLLLIRTCSRLVRHQDHRIRYILLTLLRNIHSICTRSLAHLIENVLIDVIVLLLNDSYEEISTLSEKVRNHLMVVAKDNFLNHLRECLYSLSNTIPAEVVVRGDVKGCLKQLLGVLMAIRTDPNSFLLGGRLPEQLTFALSSALRLNVKRLRVSSEVTERNDILWILDSLPFLHDIEKETVCQIAAILVETGQSYVLMDCISTNVGRVKEMGELTGNYLFSTYLLRSAYSDSVKLTETFVDTLQILVEQAVALLERAEIHRPPRDDHIEDDNEEQGEGSCLVAVLLAFCAAAFTCAPSVFVCQKLMNETLFELFKWTKSSYTLCKESAECALKAAALTAGEADISSLCVTYGKYLLPKVAICSRTYDRHLRTPCVLSSLLDHCSSPELFTSVRHAVEELLLAIDIGSQEWLILILKAALSFVVAVGKWFLEARPQKIDVDEDDPDKKSTKHDFVEDVNNVLKRTKHLLFCSYLPVRLLILRIIDACLRDLQYFPDDYLPMIHQNWPAVLDCLLDKNVSVRHAGFQVIVTMCELSGTFCYRRFIPEAWVLIRRFMLERSAASANAERAYFHSAAYKYQETVLEKLAVIFQQIEARNVDWQSVLEVAEAYCNDSQPKILQNAAKSLLFTCHTKLRRSS